jgi:antitoxin MazE
LKYWLRSLLREIEKEYKKLTLALARDLPDFTLDELLEQVTEPPEPEVDWGKPMGKEI